MKPIDLIASSLTGRISRRGVLTTSTRSVAVRFLPHQSGLVEAQVGPTLYKGRFQGYNVPTTLKALRLDRATEWDRLRKWL